MNQENSDSKICPICGRPTHKESKYCIFHAGAEEKTEEEFKKALKEYVNKIKEKASDYNFKKFIFVGNIDFKNDLDIAIFKNVYFEEATFESFAAFEKATFKGDANFREATFKGDADFGQSTFQRDADFTRSNFKKFVYFRSATFNGDVDFWEVKFNGGVNFQEANFNKFTYFNNANFGLDANFQKATFKEYVHFDWATFPMSADFRRANFKSDANFLCTTFKWYAYFRRVTFEDDAHFMEATFEGDADFRRATFESDADFRDAIFEEDVYFKGITFHRNADFKKATFKGDAYFHIKSFVKSIIFTNVNILPGKKINLKVENNKGNVSFERAYLEDAYLNIDFIPGVLIDFTDTLLRNTKMERDQIENHILQEEKRGFSEAKQVYLLLKNNFHSIGRYNDESWAFKKEKDMERKSYCCFKSLHKWLWSCFLNIIYGYGEKPWNVIFSAGFIIIFFSLFFSVIGIANPEIIELNGTAIHQNSGNIVNLASKGFLKSNVIRNFPDSLYFSLITFTTLGYGDFRPLEGWGRILAGSEAFIGAFMMALFVYTFARRTGGR